MGAPETPCISRRVTYSAPQHIASLDKLIMHLLTVNARSFPNSLALYVSDSPHPTAQPTHCLKACTIHHSTRSRLRHTVSALRHACWCLLHFYAHKTSTEHSKRPGACVYCSGPKSPKYFLVFKPFSTGTFSVHHTITVRSLDDIHEHRHARHNPLGGRRLCS